MKKTNFKVEKMDCPCEENLIRMKLDGNKSVNRLDFDLYDRTLSVFHTGDSGKIAKEIESLNLDSHLIDTVEVTNAVSTDDDTKQRKVLWIVLAINFAFFLIEITIGILSKSMGLVADSLDMFADAIVYGMSLLVVGAAVKSKKRVALWSGILQILLALSGIIEIVRRFLGHEIMPDFRYDRYFITCTDCKC